MGRPALWLLGLLWLIAVGPWIRDLGSMPAEASNPLRTFAGQDTIPPELLFVVWEDTLPDGSPAPIADGDTLRVATHWNQGGLTVEADLSGLDTNFVRVPLIADVEADSIYLLEFTSEDLLTDGSKTVPLIATHPELTGEFLFDLPVCVLNAAPRLLSLEVLPDRSSYRPNDILRVQSNWVVPFGPGEVYADLRSIDPSLEGLVQADTVGTSFLLTYRIPVFGEERTGNHVIPLLCRNTLCGGAVDTSLSVTLTLDRTTPPTLVDWEILAPVDVFGNPKPVVNGDTIRLHTTWDRAGLIVGADAYALAPADTNRPVVLERGPGEFEVIYTIPLDNDRQDAADLPFRLIAEDLDGESTIDSSVRFCLSNRQPEHIGTELELPRTTLRGGDTLLVRSRWLSGNRLPLSLELDVERLEPGVTGPELGEIADSIGDSLLVFELSYRIPPDRDSRGPDGIDIRLPLTCREVGGCATVRFEDLIRFDLDTTAPDTTGPTLDPLVSQTTEDSILVSGQTVTDAARVALSRQNSFQSYTSVDTLTGRFSGWVQLLPDTENRLRAWAEDELGNRTRSSEPETVLQVSSLVIDFDQPFLRGGDLRVSDPEGLLDLSVTIFDLEGGAVRSWDEAGPTLDRSWTWDGNDRDGDAVRQGYYLIRAVWTDADGSRHEKTTGLVLGD